MAIRHLCKSGLVGTPRQDHTRTACAVGRRGEIADRIGRWPADAEIGESMFGHDSGIEQIATIDDDGISERLLRRLRSS